MVAKVISGKSIGGALRYNETKVQQGKAQQLMAYNFPSDDLSIRQKVGRFEALTSQNRRCTTNAVHISLNFDPSEQPDDFTLRRIALTYMDKIGFAGQPFLLYRHYDAAHAHVHIVTTNIKDGGERISLHNIGKNQSEQARKEIEHEFNLVAAEGKNKEYEMYLKPVSLEKASYGKSETKASISSIVREVVPTYKYSSLAELNAILRLYNVIADRGSDGTKMFDKGGLVYSLLDDKGNKIGVPIKASSLYSQPTLPKLEKRFAKNKLDKKEYKDRLRNVIDGVIKTEGVVDKDSFVRQLEKEEISVTFRQNEHGRIYGITFIDHLDKMVFNGSDLDKTFSAGNILRRLSEEEKTRPINKDWNEQYIKDTLYRLDYSKGFPAVLSELYRKGIRISVQQNQEKVPAFMLGHYRCPIENHWQADKKWAAYLTVNRMDKRLVSELSRQKEQYQRTDNMNYEGGDASGKSISPAPSINTFFLEKFIKEFLNALPSNDGPVQQQVPQKKKKKRRI